MGGLRRPWPRRYQVLVSPEQRTEQKYKLQSSSEASLRGKETIVTAKEKTV
jgi:hypothetical protein